MKKYVLAVLGALALITIIVMTQIPANQVKAQEDSEFDIQNGILVSYNGIETQVSIPGNVTVIGPEAFQNKKLTNVTIPSTVERLERGAFYGCKDLARVTLEEGVRSIGGSAFSNCEKLNSIVIPASVTKIGAGAFSGCSSLLNITVSPGNQKFFCNDGVLYNIDSTELIQYLAGRKATSFTVPFTVNKIDSFAFWGANLLTRVEVSNNVKSIDAYTFANCKSLTDVFLPESVERIDSYAFSNCTNLTYAGMENSAVNIAETSFQNCSKDLQTEQGVTRAEMSSAQKKAVEETADSTDSTAVVSSRSSKVTLKSPLSTINDRKQIDMSSPTGLIGATKIVGGSALVILDDKETKSISKNTVSKNTVSKNTVSQNTRKK